MTCLFLMFLWTCLLEENPFPTVPGQNGVALVICARLGMPPERICEVFGTPELSVKGRWDWRTNPDPYLLLAYQRYGVWIEWEAGPIPRIGKSSGIQAGGILPRSTHLPD